MRPPGRVQPISPVALAERIAVLAQALISPAAPAVRVGIDAPVEPDGRELAAGVVRALEAAAVPAGVLHAIDFLRPRSLRLEFGRDQMSSYDLWYDVDGLRRESLDRLGPGGDGSWLARLRDPRTDRSVRAPRQESRSGTIVVIDGRFLLRAELRGAFDLVVHLDVSRAARERRTPRDDAPLAVDAWNLYLSQADPVAQADLVVRFDHPGRPALLPSAAP